MIYLGTPGDLREYTILKRGNTLSYSQTQANPFAPRLTSGSEFDEIDAWDEWGMTSWQAGVGRKNPEAGGFLYAEMETRFPDQFFLGPKPTTYVTRAQSQLQTHTISQLYNSTGTVAWRLTAESAPDSGTISNVWVYLLSKSAQTITLAHYDSTGGTPNTLQTTSAQAISETYTPAWVSFPMGSASVVDNDYLVLSGTNLEVPLISTPAVIYSYGTAGWTSVVGDGPGLQVIAADPSRSGMILSQLARNDTTDTLIGAERYYSGAGQLSKRVYRSTDNGASWTGIEVYSGLGFGFNSIAVGASNVWCVNCCGQTDGTVPLIGRSTDDGATWGTVTSGSSSQLGLGPKHGAGDIDTDGTAVWCSIHGKYDEVLARIWRSTDNGATWAEVQQVSNGGPYNGIHSNVNYIGGSIWYGAVTQNQTTQFISSYDNGATWGTPSTDITGSSNSYIGYNICKFNNNIYLPIHQIPSSTDTGVYRSTNDGTAWSQVLDIDAVGIWQNSDTELFALASNGNIWATSDGTAWTQDTLSVESESYARGPVWDPDANVGYIATRTSIYKRTGTDTLAMPAYILSDDGISSTDTDTVRLIKYNSNMYLFNESNRYDFDSANNKWGTANAIGTPGLEDALAWGGSVWLAMGSNDVQTMGTAETFTNRASEDASLWLNYNGYLWRAYQNFMYYWDGSTWAGTVQVGPDDNYVRGMAGMGGTIYMATDDGLWYVGDGDVALGISQWGKYDTTNGRGMIEYQGALYIPVGQDLLRYDSSGAIGNVGLNRQEGLPDNRQGRVYAMVGLNNWLVAAVEHTASDGSSSIWAYSGEGWHHLATLPEGMKVRDMIEERDENYLWVAAATSDRIFTFRYNLPNDLTNPAKDARADYIFAPYGWMETDKMFGGQRKLDKDWESVFITGLNLTADQNARLYWQDEDSSAWELLGTVTADGQEVRWSDYTTRPVGKWIKLGVLLQSNSSTTTPIVEGIITKFLPTVNDRSRWDIQIPVHDNREFPGGSVNTTAGTAQLAHLDSLAEARVAPVIFQTLEGVQYEVKVIDHRKSVTRYDWIGGTAVLDHVYGMVLEQVTSGSYS